MGFFVGLKLVSSIRVSAMPMQGAVRGSCLSGQLADYLELIPANRAERMSNNSDQSSPVSLREMEQRVARLEDDELAAARKLYNHARWMVSLFIVFISVIFATVAFIQLSQSNTYFEQIEAVLDQGREDIEKLTGGAGFTGYRLDGEFIDNNFQMYWNGRSIYSEDRKAAELVFIGNMSMYSIDDRVGDLVLSGIEWDHQSIFTRVFSDLREDSPLFYRAILSNASRPTVVKEVSPVGQTVGVVMPFRYRAEFNSCDQYDRFVAIVRGDPPHLRTVFTPLFANAVRPVGPTDIAVELVETFPFPECDSLPASFSVRELMQEGETEQ
ncbi:MAG: hypothetical protein JJ926_08325 [Roseitalea sp.]|uniref:hypothetical protein n=1 Tax=Oceaniradius stylonematis TaxID=2184161 RepID=UPI001B18C4E2|nr:hypothetical protein [Oceaniradius stylonematis]MBO6551747.1 hypothetical protein [Roseitalea sp.]MBO6951873.1 hypothetical protein [Rhizobiaceae bacterium]MBO6592281.1 hypothetical protein [Roseitalea sp.]MBO6598536.1 hypothetical protein [Roseitalea sp.]MBO6610982.1 hypothetical protein [Roseitalea sp.]